MVAAAVEKKEKRMGEKVCVLICSSIKVNMNAEDKRKERECDRRTTPHSQITYCSSYFA